MDSIALPIIIPLIAGVHSISGDKLSLFHIKGFHCSSGAKKCAYMCLQFWATMTECTPYVRAYSSGPLPVPMTECTASTRAAASS